MSTAQAPAVLVFFSGLLAGALHVLSGPDHLAAIAPLAVAPAPQPRSVGAVWGMGHGGGVLGWFGVASLARAYFGVELAPHALEVLVGLSLLGLGAMRLRAARHAPTDPPRARRPLVAFAFGLLHGSAGATHLLALLPTLGLPLEGVLLYCAGYLLAGVLTMASAAALLAGVASRLAIVGGAQRATALVAVAVGAWWLFDATSG